jgi:hypothetical protein
MKTLFGSNEELTSCFVMKSNGYNFIGSANISLFNSKRSVWVDYNFVIDLKKI